MKAIIVDDEFFCASYLENLCSQIQNLDVLCCFSNPLEALDYLKEHDVDLVLTDIEMPGLSGMDAVREIRLVRPDAGIIFVTGYEQYAVEAFRLEVISYLMKPCDLSELQKAVHKATKLLPTAKQRVEMKTFGHFNVWIDGLPFHFANRKAKELLALLVDRRGEILSLEQVVDSLWENRPYDETVKQLYRKAVLHLHQAFHDKGLDFFVTNRGSCHIIPAKIGCDYYRLLDGDQKALEEYHGEYMLDYTWAEETVARLERMMQKN